MSVPTPSRRLIRRTAVIVLAASLAACSSTAPAPFVEDPWVRSNPNGLGAAYLTITMPTDDRLVAAEVDPSIAASIEIHEVVETDGRMLMREIEGGIALPAGRPVELRPGGLHLMLLGMPGMLEVGTSITLTLRFAESDPVEVVAEVREGATDGTPEMHHGEMPHGDAPHGQMPHGDAGHGSMGMGHTGS